MKQIATFFFLLYPFLVFPQSSGNRADTAQVPQKLLLVPNTVSPSVIEWRTGNPLQADILRQLKGKMPGVEVLPAGGLTGTGTDLIIRGYTSPGGSNQPLILVDGIRFDGRSNSTSGMFFGGGSLTTPGRALDINPATIRSVSFLKSFMATAMYGEAGRNGVLLIETKTNDFKKAAEESGFLINFEQAVYMTRISSGPDYTNKYGNGFNGLYQDAFSNWGPAFDTQDSGLFGAEFIGFDTDGTVLVEHPLLRNPNGDLLFPELVGEPYRYEPKGSPMDDFFESSISSNTGLSIYGNVDEMAVNLNFSHTSEGGFTPGNDLVRSNFGFGLNFPLTENLSNNTMLNVALTNVDAPILSASGGSGPVLPGGSGSLLADIFYTPRSIDLSMPYENPDDRSSIYYRDTNDIPHPAWVLQNTGTNNRTERYFGKSDFSFDFGNDLELRYRVAFDIYSEAQEYRQNPGGVRPTALLDGFYQTVDWEQTTLEQSLTGNGSFQLGNLFSLDLMAGLQYTRIKRERDGLESLDMVNFGLFRHSNFIQQNSVNSFTNEDFLREYESSRGGAFTNVTLGYRDALHLDMVLRAERFASPNQIDMGSYYPGIGIRYIPSNQPWFNFKWVDALTVHANLAYSSRKTLTANEIRIYNDDRTLPNEDLKPEKMQELEFGLNGSFLNGRVRLDATGWFRDMSEFFIRAPVNINTGFTSTYLNRGSMSSKGMEAILDITPVNNDLRWDISTAYYGYSSEAGDLNVGLDQIFIGDGFTFRGNVFQPDQPYGVIYGSRIVRVTQQLKSSNFDFINVPVGTPIIDANGNYQTDPELGVIGNPNPDWNLSVSNRLRYRNLSLYFRFDYQQGGDMFSTWISTMLARGITTDTEDRNRTFVLDGVDQNGDPNTIQLSPEEYYFDNVGFGQDELRVYDMTHLRLRDLSLSYDLPLSITEKLKVRDINVTLYGSNLWLYMYNVPEGAGFDPAVKSNGAGVNGHGFEYLTGPGARRFGAKVSVGF